MKTPTLLFFAATLVAAPVAGQFVKHIDEHGHVTYSDDPGYDYRQDEPAESEYQASLARQREIERSLSAQTKSAPRNRRSRRPGMTIRRRTHCPRATRTLCEAR